MGTRWEHVFYHIEYDLILFNDIKMLILCYFILFYRHGNKGTEHLTFSFLYIFYFLDSSEEFSILRKKVENQCYQCSLSSQLFKETLIFAVQYLKKGR